MHKESTIYKKIRCALEQLGYKEPDFEAKATGFPHLFKIYLDCEYFGVWDTQKETFVD